MANDEALWNDLHQMWSVLQAMAHSGEDGAPPDDLARLTGLPVAVVREILIAFDRYLDPVLAIQGDGESTWGIDKDWLARIFFLSIGERAAFQALLAAAPNLDWGQGGQATWTESPTLLFKGQGATYANVQVLQWVVELERAIAARRTVLLKAGSGRNRKAIQPYLLEPLGLIASPAGWHLAAREAGHARWRLFALDQRTRAVSTLAQRFSYPADFDLRAEFAFAWGISGIGERVTPVVVRFFDQAGAHERVRFETSHRRHARIEITPAGDLIYRDEIQGLPDFQRWLRSFGSSAEVLEPAHLRELMASSARRLLARYQPVATATT